MVKVTTSAESLFAVVAHRGGQLFRAKYWTRTLTGRQQSLCSPSAGQLWRTVSWDGGDTDPGWPTSSTVTGAAWFIKHNAGIANITL